MQPKADELMIYSFREEKDINFCRLTTDNIFGGKTKADFSHDTILPLELTEREIHNSSGQNREKLIKFRELFTRDIILNEEETETTASTRIIPKQGSCKFSGVLNIELPVNNSAVERSGFACLQTPKTLYPLDLDYYTGLELRLRTDGRFYVIQIKIDSPVNDDLYQCILPTLPTNKWCRVFLPFSDFLLTWRGYAEEYQPPKELHSVRHIGILMAERASGPFCLHIDWIKARREIATERLNRLSN